MHIPFRDTRRFERRRKRGTTISAVIVGNFHFSRSDSLVVKKRNEQNPFNQRCVEVQVQTVVIVIVEEEEEEKKQNEKKRENFDDAFSSFVRSYNTTNRGIPPPFSIRFHSYGVHVPFLRNDQNVGRYKRRYRFFFFCANNDHFSTIGNCRKTVTRGYL